MMSDDPLRWEPWDRHWIRLRGPWEVSWVAPIESTPPSIAGGRVQLPAAWHELFGLRQGTARFSRRFQRPTHLDPDERVLVTLCDVRCEVSARLNGSPLATVDAPIGDPASAPCENAMSFEVTHLLQSTNLLTLDLTVNDEKDCDAEYSDRSRGLWQPVLLEIITPD